MKKHLGQTPSVREYTERLAPVATESCAIDPALYEEYGVKRGLRDKSGKGVLAGLTNISDIVSSKTVGGETVPCEGELYYRGYDINSLIGGIAEGQPLRLRGNRIPAADGRPARQGAACRVQVRAQRAGHAADQLRARRGDEGAERGHDEHPRPQRADAGLLRRRTPHVARLRERAAAMLSSSSAVFPMLAVYGYHAYNHYVCDDSFYIHRPDRSLSTAENILRMLRPDRKYTRSGGQGAGHRADPAYGARRRQQLDLHHARRDLLRQRHLLRPSPPPSAR